MLSVSIQLISLASRNIAELGYPMGGSLSSVSIQLISLASRNSALVKGVQTDGGAKFPFN